MKVTGSTMIFLFLVVLSGCLPADAFIRFVCPRPMHPSSVITQAPCGTNKQSHWGDFMELGPGPLTLHFEQTFFQPGASLKITLGLYGNRSASCPLLQHIPQRDIKIENSDPECSYKSQGYPLGRCDDKLYVTVKIPNLLCSRCYLQAELLVPENGETCESNGVKGSSCKSYFTCANVQLRYRGNSLGSFDDCMRYPTNLFPGTWPYSADRAVDRHVLMSGPRSHGGLLTGSSVIGSGATYPAVNDPHGACALPSYQYGAVFPSEDQYNYIYVQIHDVRAKVIVATSHTGGDVSFTVNVHGQELELSFNPGQRGTGIHVSTFLLSSPVTFDLRGMTARVRVGGSTSSAQLTPVIGAEIGGPGEFTGLVTVEPVCGLADTCSRTKVNVMANGARSLTITGPAMAGLSTGNNRLDLTGDIRKMGHLQAVRDKEWEIESASVIAWFYREWMVIKSYKNGEVISGQFVPPGGDFCAGSSPSFMCRQGIVTLEGAEADPGDINLNTQGLAFAMLRPQYNVLDVFITLENMAGSERILDLRITDAQSGRLIAEEIEDQEYQSLAKKSDATNRFKKIEFDFQTDVNLVKDMINSGSLKIELTSTRYDKDNEKRKIKGVLYQRPKLDGAPPQREGGSPSNPNNLPTGNGDGSATSATLNLSLLCVAGVLYPLLVR